MFRPDFRGDVFLRRLPPLLLSALLLAALATSRMGDASAADGAPAATAYVLPEGSDGSIEPQPLPAALVPEGFLDEVVATGLLAPTSFAFLPDGRILVAEQAGVVRVIQDGALLDTPLLDIRAQVNSYFERGLLAIAPDPDFAINGFLYALYVYEHDPTQENGPKTGRLSRFTVSGGVASPETEVVLLGTTSGNSCNDFPTGTDCLPEDYRSHNGGAIRFATDGSLFVSTGYAGTSAVHPDALRAQDLDVLAGKMLHMSRDGQGLPTNPFWNGDPNANRSKVWASGLRNPFRFVLQPGTDLPFVGDVGWDEWEEIDVAEPGANFGWPCFEGRKRQRRYASMPLCQELHAQDPPTVTAPVFVYPTRDGGSVIGGPFYTSDNYPEQFRGAYFYGDYVHGFIRYFSLDDANRMIDEPSELAACVRGLAAMELGPDGLLYYASVDAGELHLFQYLDPTAGWISPSPPDGMYLAEYFDNPSLELPTKFRRCEPGPDLEHDWRKWGPENGLSDENFSIRWTGRFLFEPGDYVFTAKANDAIRVSVGDALIVDSWRLQDTTEYQSTTAVPAGEHVVTVEYANTQGQGLVEFDWAPVPLSNRNGAPHQLGATTP